MIESDTLYLFYDSKQKAIKKAKITKTPAFNMELFKTDLASAEIDAL